MKRIATLLALLAFAGQWAAAQYQIPNSGFEEWESVSSGMEPKYWNSFVTGTGSAKSMAAQEKVKPETGRTGNYSAKIWQNKPVSFLDIIAQGNVTTGCINMGSTNAADAQGNFNYENYGDGQARKFTGRPDKMRFFVKSKTSGWRANTILHTAGNYQDAEYNGENKLKWKADATVVGKAEQVASPAYSSWTEIVIPFKYYGEVTTYYKATAGALPVYALVTFTTNKPGGGADKDWLLIDDLEYVYLHSLTGISYNGAGWTVPSVNGTQSVTIPSAYDASKLAGTSDGRFATIDKSFNAATGLLTVSVKGDDYGVASTEVDNAAFGRNPNSISVYKFQLTAQHLSAVTLSKTAISLVVDESHSLLASMAPAYAANKNVTWSSDKPAVATVDAQGRVVAVGEGQATITCAAADGGNAKATCVVTVNKVTPSISWNLNPTSYKIGKTITLNATSTNTQKPIVYTLRPKDATTGGKTITSGYEFTTEDGEYDIWAEQAGTAKFNKVSTMRSITVGKNSQRIEWAEELTATCYVGGAVSLDAASYDGNMRTELPVGYSYVYTPEGGSPEAEQTLDAAATTFACAKAGVYKLTASQPGNAAYSPAADVTMTIVCKRKAQTIDNWPATASKYVGDVLALDAASHPVEGGVEYAMVQDGVSTLLTGTEYQLPGAAQYPYTVTLRATRPGNDEYEPAKPADMVVTVAQKPQSVEWLTRPADVYYDVAVTLSASNDQGRALSFELDGAPTASAELGTLSVGQHTVRAYNDGLEGGLPVYAPAEATATFNVKKYTLTLAWAPELETDLDGNRLANDGTALPLNATAKEGKVDKTADVSIVYLLGDRALTPTDGSYTLTAEDAGSGVTYRAQARVEECERYYAAESQPFTLIVEPNLMPQKLTWGPYQLTCKVSEAKTVTFDATTDAAGKQGAEGIEPWYSLNGERLTASQTAKPFALDQAGTYEFVCGADGNETFNRAKNIAYSIAVVKSAAELTWDVQEGHRDQGTVLSLNATSTNPAQSIVYYVNGEPYSGTSLALAAGSTRVEVRQPANKAYYAANLTKTFSVDRSAQTITWNPKTEVTVGDEVSLDATTEGGGACRYTLEGEELQGKSYTFGATGAVTIVVEQSGSDGYSAAAPISKTFTVGPASQTISWLQIQKTTVAAGEQLALQAVSDRGLPILFKVKDGRDLVNGQVSFDTPGTVTLVAYNGGSADYAAASAECAITVDKASQTISWEQTFPGSYTVGDVFDLRATASSGLPVSYTPSMLGCLRIVTDAAGAARAEVVAVPDHGTLSLAAEQHGDDLYLSAAQVAKGINIVAPAATGLLLQPAKLTVKTGERFEVAATVAPYGADIEGIAWSFNKVIYDNATVTSRGSQCEFQAPATPTAEGETLPVTVTLGELKATCQVTVLPAADDLTLVSSIAIEGGDEPTTGPAHKALTMGLGGATLTAVVTPQECANAGVEWNSGNAAIVRVDQTGHLTPVAKGQATVTVTSRADDRLTATCQVTVAGRTQTISYNVPDSYTAFVGEPVALDAKASSLLPIVYNVTKGGSAANLVTVVNGTATFDAEGVYEIAATQPGNGEYEAAETVSHTITVSRQPQTITLTASATTVEIGQLVTFTASSTSGLPVTLKTNDQTITPQTRFTASGDIAVVASQAGNDSYAPATEVTLGIKVGKKAQRIMLDNPIVEVGLGEAYHVVAAATSGLPVGIAQSDGTAVDNGTVFYNAPGSYELTLTQPGNDTWDAATARKLTLSVAQRQQVVTLQASATDIYVGDRLTLLGTSNAGLPVKYYNAAGEEIGAVQTPAKSGQYIYYARSLASGVYGPAEDNVTVNVKKRTQTVQLLCSRTSALIGDYIGFQAVATSGLDVTLTDDKDQPFQAYQVPMEKGEHYYKATQPGNDKWEMAEVSVAIPVGSVKQEIEIVASTTKAHVGDRVSFVAQATSGLPVTLLDPDGQPLDKDGSFTFVKPGKHTFVAKQDGEAPYEPAQNSIDVEVTTTPQSIHFAASAQECYVGETVSFVANSDSRLPVVVKDKEGNTVGGSVRYTQAGTYTYTATQAGTSAIAPAENEELTVKVSRKTPELLFFLSEDHVLAGAKVSLHASCSNNEEVEVTYKKDGKALADGLPEPLTKGTYEITASQAESDEWAAVSETKTLVVGEKKQTVSFTVNGASPLEARPQWGEAVTLEAKTDAGEEVAVTIKPVVGQEDGEALTGPTVTFDKAGNYTYRVEIPGSEMWEPFNQTFTVVVERKAPTLSWKTAGQYKVGQEIVLEVESESNGAVIYYVDGQEKASGKYTPKKAGKYTITAHQNPDAEGKWTAAELKGSEALVLEVSTALEQPAAAGLDARVYTEGGCVVVAGSEGSPVGVYDLAGRRLYAGGDVRLPLQRGLYVVTIGGRAVRVRL